MLRYAGFGVGAVDLAEGVADFADGGVGPDGIEDMGHSIGGRNIAVRFGFRILGGGSL